MRVKKVLAACLAASLAIGLTACGNSSSSSSSSSAAGGDSTNNEQALSYKDIVLGESYTDITTTISFFSNRTDMLEDSYNGVAWESYITEFNKMYPNITVDISASTNYNEDALLRLQSKNWGDVMMIPAMDKSEFENYFISYGDLKDVALKVNYVSDSSYEGKTYGIPITAASRGVVYNKAVFKAAGVTELPKTTEEFMDALKAIADKTDAIPLYTNYADGWPMGAWDDYIGYTATGDTEYMNITLVHSAEPFADPGDGTGAYNVYKILYDAVKNGLTEDDYSTTEWETSKGMINNGEIGCMVLGSWAFSQMQAAGEHADDIGYMPFPISKDGEQFATASPDYKFGINVNSSSDNQKAAMVFVKWMTEKSGYSYNEGGLPIAADDDKFPATYEEFTAAGLEFVPDDAANAGEENYRSELNTETELNIANSGNTKIQEIVEHAANGDKEFDEIMDEWNQKWNDAQKTLGISAE